MTAWEQKKLKLILRYREKISERLRAVGDELFLRGTQKQALHLMRRWGYLNLAPVPLPSDVPK